MNTQPLFETLPERDVYTVKRLNLEARLLLEVRFKTLWLEGEISNFRCPSSQHWYFTLKEEGAEVRAAMFRLQNTGVKFTPKDGMHVLVRAKVSLFEARGDYQLIVESMEEVGDGRLQRAFLALKLQLHNEGLFALDQKKPLPTFPRAIGIITSNTGAAIHDILSVLKRRCASIPVIIYPSQVQGARAADDLIRALQTANRRNECDVIVLARGGGSLEDLWPFNEERLARAIFASRIPIVSAVGHESDVTIADFVSDVRAATPSAAAELIAPESRSILQQLRRLQNSLIYAFQQSMKHWHSQVMHLAKRLQHPGQRLAQQMQQLDHARDRLLLAVIGYLTARHKQTQALVQQLHQQHPLPTLLRQKASCEQLQQQMINGIECYLQRSHHQLSQLACTLHSVSPLATLSRGYAIVMDENQQVLLDTQGIHVGERIIAHLSHGELHCTVDEIS